MAFTVEQVEKLNGVVLCAANGDPIPVTLIDVVSTVNQKTGETRDELQIGGLAEAYLVNPTNPQAGVKALEEPFEVATVQRLSDDPKEGDAHILLQTVSRWLKLPVPLEQDGEGLWLEQFTDTGDPESVYAKLKEKGVYLKVSKAKDVETKLKFGQTPFYANLHVMPDRAALDKSAVSALREKWKAKAAAKAAAEEAAGAY